MKVTILKLLSVAFLAVVGICMLLGLAKLSFIDPSVERTAAAAYLCLAAPGLVSMFFLRDEFWVKKASLVVPLCLILAYAPYKFYTFAAFLPLLMVTRKRGELKALVAVLMVPVAILVMLDLAFWGFGSQYATANKYSPDGTHRIEVFNADAGATGGDTVANLYLILPGKVMERLQGPMYHHSWNPDLSVKWLNNEQVLIEGQKMNIARFKLIYDDGLGRKSVKAN